MAKRVVVSSAQRAAARAMVQRSAVTGRHVSSSVRKIANAKVQTINGQQAGFVTGRPVPGTS